MYPRKIIPCIVMRKPVGFKNSIRIFINNLKVYKTRIIYVNNKSTFLCVNLNSVHVINTGDSVEYVTFEMNEIFDRAR